MPALFSPKDWNDFAQISVQFAAECEAVNIISEMPSLKVTAMQIPGDDWRERIENLAWDVRQFGCRYTAPNSGLLYDFS